jgi:hypothetical protein
VYVHLYSKAQGVWTVGRYSPDGEWHALEDHEDGATAAIRVAHLNGALNSDDTVPTDDFGELVGRVVARAVARERQNAEALQQRHDTLSADMTRLRNAAEHLVRAYLSLHIYGFACAGGQADVERFRGAFRTLGEVLGIKS